MAKKARSILFILLAGVLLFSVIGYLSASKIAPGIVQKPTSSVVEKRDYKTLKDVKNASFFAGTAQDVFERYAADGVPMRDSLLYLNAAVQRDAISCGALLNGISVYPTYYGSAYYEVSDMGFLVKSPDIAPQKQSEALKAWLDTLNAAAKRHPEISFAYVAVTESHQSEFNPIYDLKVGEFVDSAWVEANVIDGLDSSIDASVDSISSTDEIPQTWFVNDVHWSLERGLETYNLAAEKLGLEHVSYQDPVEVVDEWHGGYSRVGLDKRYAETLWDMPMDFSNLSFYKIKDDVLAKKKIDPGKRTETLASSSKKMKQSNEFQGYTAYYGTFNGLVVNDGENNGRNCLLIGDSFTHCLKRYVANNYANTYVIMPGNYTTNRSLEDYIEEYDIDDVLVITQARKYGSVAETSPAFVGLKKSQGSQNAEDDVER